MKKFLLMVILITFTVILTGCVKKMEQVEYNKEEYIELVSIEEFDVDLRDSEIFYTTVYEFNYFSGDCLRTSQFKYWVDTVKVPYEYDGVSYNGIIRVEYTDNIDELKPYTNYTINVYVITNIENEPMIDLKIIVEDQYSIGWTEIEVE